MRIAFLIDSLSIGGAERVVTTLAQAFGRSGVEVRILTIGDARGAALSEDLPVRNLSLTGQHRGLGKLVATLRRVRVLRAALRDEAPDALICFMPQVSVLGWLAARGLAMRVVLCPRNAPWRRRQGALWDRLFRMALRRADAVVCQTGPIADWVETATGRQAHIIENPVSVPLARFSPEVPPALDPARRYALVVGGKRHQKGVDLALEALFRTEALSDWGLVLVGETDHSSLNRWWDQHLPDLDRTALEIANRLVRPGIVGNIEDWYAACDLFVLSSRFEGQPNALIEALATGTPSLAFTTDTAAVDFAECPGLTCLTTTDVETLSQGLLAFAAEATPPRNPCSRVTALTPDAIATKWRTLLEMDA